MRRIRNPETGESFTFKPTGEKIVVGATPNPPGWTFDEPPLTATIFVGLSVGEKKLWTYDDLIQAVVEYLRGRDKPVDGSFVIQKGTYTSEAEATKGQLVIEDSSQVVIMSTGGWPNDESFIEDMRGIGEHLIHRLLQEKVYVAISRGGAFVVTYEVISEALKAKRDAEALKAKRAAEPHAANRKRRR